MYILVKYSNEKVSLRGSVSDKIEHEAFVEYDGFVEGNGDISVRSQMRKQLLGHAMGVGVQGGFGNLSSMKVNLAPSDMLIDSKIFKFSGMTGCV